MGPRHGQPAEPGVARVLQGPAGRAGRAGPKSTTIVPLLRVDGGGRRIVPGMLIWIELGFVILSIILAFWLPGLASGWFCKAERNFAAIARHRGLSILLVGLGALAVRGAVLPILPIPQAHINDEFSPLLLADTLAHG